MSTKFRSPETELWIRMVQAVAVTGLCLSLLLSVYLYGLEMNFDAEVAQIEGRGNVTAKAVLANAAASVVTLSRDQIAEVTGQADMLNRILYGSLTFTAKQGSILNRQDDHASGGAL